MSRFGVGGVSPLWNAGFVCNPFRALSNTEWEELALLPATVQRIVESGNLPHLQILGAAGRGKSSVLRGVKREASRLHRDTWYEYIPQGVDRFSTDVPAGGWFCLDEAQRLGNTQRATLLRTAIQRSHRLVLASHEDLRPFFEAHGMPLATVLLDDLGKTHHRTVLQNRLTYFARPNELYATLTDDAWHALLERFGSDLRSTERFLYEYFHTSVHVAAPIEIDFSN